jgi:hypothetical protein
MAPSFAGVARRRGVEQVNRAKKGQRTGSGFARWVSRAIEEVQE